MISSSSSSNGIEAAAKTRIEVTSVELQTQIVSAGLTSKAALEFMARLPSAQELMQPLEPVEIEKLILEDKRRYWNDNG